jgi:D-alanyl-D-alanine dipeptidase
MRGTTAWARTVAWGIDTLLCSALLCAPLSSAARGKPPRLVDLAQAIPTLRVKLRYASANNFLKRRLYPKGARALARPALAKRLAKVQRRLARRGLGLLIWDAYRPRRVQWALWRALPDRRYVADPRRGSDHNRGGAVDLTLVRLPSGKKLAMPTDHDAAGPKAHRGARRGISAPARKNAALLDREMRRAGFVPLRTEWWHFSVPEAKRWRVLDLPLVRAP